LGKVGVATPSPEVFFEKSSKSDRGLSFSSCFFHDIGYYYGTRNEEMQMNGA